MISIIWCLVACLVVLTFLSYLDHKLIVRLMNETSALKMVLTKGERNE